MGGFGSGRQGGRPTADASRRIDLAWLVRTGRITPGYLCSGSLSWSIGDKPAGSISYEADMRDLDAAKLSLSFTQGNEPDREHVRQIVQLTWTRPHYGGRRWWFICPYSGRRAGKLYLPPWGDRFAGRAAWRLGYQSQRVERSQRAFDAMFRLQKKLGCHQGWEAGLFRPKGMHRRTFDRHLNRYLELDGQCAAAMWSTINRLSDLANRSS